MTVWWASGAWSRGVVVTHPRQQTTNWKPRGERTRGTQTAALNAWKRRAAVQREGVYVPRRRVGISGATALTVSDTLMEQQVLHERRVQQLDKALRRILSERIEHLRAAEACRDAQRTLTSEVPG